MIDRLQHFPLFVSLWLLVVPAEAQVPTSSIEDFFESFTDEWMRNDPNLGVRSQYFAGEEGDRLSRELTPVSRAYQLDGIRRAEEELRDRMRAALGEEFSIREFHNVVPSAGVVPLTVLEREVDAHISRAR